MLWQGMLQWLLEKKIIIHNKKCFWQSEITDVFVDLHKNQAERDATEAWSVSSSHKF